jgi:hypothetical protein
MTENDNIQTVINAKQTQHQAVPQASQQHIIGQHPR